MNLPPVPSSIQPVVDRLLATHDYVLPGGLLFSPNLLMAILTVFLIFLLIITFASLRHRYLGWHIKGILPGLGFGFILALILEGFLILGGRTILTEIFGWKNAPKPVSVALDAGRSQFIKVLGENTSAVPESNAQSSSGEDLYHMSQSLPTKELNHLKELLCK